MTHSFRRFLPLVLAAAAATSLSCKRARPATEVALAAKPPASASLVTAPAASTAPVSATPSVAYAAKPLPATEPSR